MMECMLVFWSSSDGDWYCELGKKDKREFSTQTYYNSIIGNEATYQVKLICNMDCNKQMKNKLEYKESKYMNLSKGWVNS